MELLRAGPAVRYVDQRTASVWLELTTRAAVLLTVEEWPATSGVKGLGAGEPHIATTVQVGVRHFALAYVTNLKPDTVYTYRLEIAPLHRLADPPTSPQRFRRLERAKLQPEPFAISRAGPLLRTLPGAKTESLRLAFGSCRKLFGGAQGTTDSDALAAFHAWLLDRASNPRAAWPHFLLLVGDQIYADDVPALIRDALLEYRRKQWLSGTRFTVPKSLDSVRPSETNAGIGKFHLMNFEEYAYMYEWSYGPPEMKEVRKVFANLPTFRVLDDHEITDDWNITGGWFAQMKDTIPWSELAVDAMVAYWMYQGWGNLNPVESTDERVKLLQKHVRAGTNALESLRLLIYDKLETEPSNRLGWSYRIPSSPPVLVLDVKNDRELRLPPLTGTKVYASVSDRIMSRPQMEKLYKALAGHDEPIILASGVPLLLPYPMDVGELLFTRPADTQKSDQASADALEEERRSRDLEQWPAFPQSMVDFVELLRRVCVKTRKHRSFVVLSGDVHFSYAMWWRVDTRSADPSQGVERPFPVVTQLVSSPLWNRLVGKDRQNLTSFQDKLKEYGFNVEEGGPAHDPSQDGHPMRRAGLFSFVAKSKVASAISGDEPGRCGPQFTKLENTVPADLVGQLLLTNTITTLVIPRDRLTVSATWWVPDSRSPPKLVPACTYSNQLSG